MGVGKWGRAGSHSAVSAVDSLGDCLTRHTRLCALAGRTQTPCLPGSLFSAKSELPGCRRDDNQNKCLQSKVYSMVDRQGEQLLGRGCGWGALGLGDGGQGPEQVGGTGTSGSSQGWGRVRPWGVRWGCHVPWGRAVGPGLSLGVSLEPSVKGRAGSDLGLRRMLAPLGGPLGAGEGPAVTAA